MKRVILGLGAWIDERTGHRTHLARIFDEPLPAGTGWWATLGAVLFFGIAVEIVTGLALSLWYAPTPDHAWDSVRFIMTSVRGGRLIRGLHYWGSTVIVSAAVLHLVRVVVIGAYRKPRELNWIVGLLLLQVILAFAMTGYLLPWDQRAYWATVVRVSIAHLTPGLGDFAATMMRGGADLGAMTLLRWYAMHALILPLILVLLIVAHSYLRRRVGAAGPVRARSAGAFAYFPSQAWRELVMVAAVAALLVALAWHGMPALESQADPTSGDYLPRPEWYFAGLFQFVKLFPGKFEVIGAMVIPGITLTVLALLPWIDRGRSRALRDRAPVLALVGAGAALVTTFTMVGAMDRVPRAGATWTLSDIAGATLINTGDRCVRCHTSNGVAAPIQPGRISHAQDWIAAHVADPEMIAPGLRAPPESDQRDTQAILAAIAKYRAGAPPVLPAGETHVAVLLNHFCLSCHTIDGFGGKDGPDLTHEGAKATAADIARRIVNPKSVKPDAQMKSFDGKIAPDDIQALAHWLAARR